MWNFKHNKGGKKEGMGGILPPVSAGDNGEPPPLAHPVHPATHVQQSEPRGALALL